MIMYIYFWGVLVSLLIVAISSLVKLREIHKNKELYILTLGDVFFGTICVFASWVTVITFVAMCISSKLEHIVIKKF